MGKSREFFGGRKRRRGRPRKRRKGERPGWEGQGLAAEQDGPTAQDSEPVRPLL
jgi:hypothetical protein